MLSLCCPKCMWCDVALRMIARKPFSPCAQLTVGTGRKQCFAQLIFYLSTVSVPVYLFHVDAGTMLYRVQYTTEYGFMSHQREFSGSNLYIYFLRGFIVNFI